MKSKSGAQMKRLILGVPPLILAVLLSAMAAESRAALETWSCDSVATFTGYVAVDRDLGIPRENRERATLTAFGAVAQLHPETIQSDMEDADALIGIVRGVYESGETSRTLRNRTLRDCAGKGWKVPVFVRGQGTRERRI